MKSVRIFVLQHAPCDLPSVFDNRDVYSPIQCGSAIHDHLDGCIRDAEGDNISALNVHFNEMTAIYWVVKHYEELGNPEYVGFDHYRRFLNWAPEWLRPGCVVARRWFSWRSLGRQYDACHCTKDREIFSEQFRAKMGLEYADYDAYWRTHGFYICNVFIMHRNEFRRYGEFIGSCISILKELDAAGRFEKHSGYQDRVPSFLLEEMTSYWIWHEKRSGRIVVHPSTITHFDIENKENGGGTVKRRGFLWFLRQAY